MVNAAPSHLGKLKGRALQASGTLRLNIRACSSELLGFVQALGAVAVCGRLLDRVRGDSELGAGKSKVGISTVFDGDACNA